MNEKDFPVGVWGDVVRSPSNESSVNRVRIDKSPPVGFVIITKEPGGTFDVWVETEEEVIEFLSAFEVVWNL